MGIHSAHVVWGVYPRPVLLGGRAICFMRYAYGNAHGPCGMEAYGNTHELYGNAYERCDYLHGGMGAETGWGVRRCVRGGRAGRCAEECVMQRFAMIRGSA